MASITPKITAACARSLIIRPNMTIDAIGTMMIEITSSRLLQGLGFSNGWAELGPKKPPPLVPSCLIATSAATGPTAIVCVPALERGRLGGASKRHRHAGRHQQDRDDGRQAERARSKSPRISVQVEVAQSSLAAQAANHRQHHGQPAGRRHELQPDDRAELAEIREMLLARIMLEIGVGHERADRVEDHGRVGPGMVGPRHVLVAERRERALAVGVQERQMALREQDRERDHEECRVEGEDARTRIASSPSWPARGGRAA